MHAGKLSIFGWRVFPWVVDERNSSPTSRQACPAVDNYVTLYTQGGHTPGKPGKPGKIVEFKSGQGKVREKVFACVKFGQLFLRKMIEIVSTRCQILRLKSTKFVFGWGSAPDLQRSPSPLSWI